MKLLIFGSTGDTGRHILEQALEQGHTVTAFVRDPSKLPLQHPNLKTYQHGFAATDKNIQVETSY